MSPTSPATTFRGPMMVVVWSDREGILGVNDGFCALTRTPASELVGRPVAQLSTVLGDEFGELAARARASGREVTGILDLQGEADVRLRVAVTVSGLNLDLPPLARHVAVAHVAARIHGASARDRQLGDVSDTARSGAEGFAVKPFLEVVARAYRAGSPDSSSLTVDCDAQVRVRAVARQSFRRCVWELVNQGWEGAATMSVRRLRAGRPQFYTGQCAHCGVTFSDKWIAVEVACLPPARPLQGAARAHAISNLGPLVHAGGGHLMVATGDSGEACTRLLFVPG